MIRSNKATKELTPNLPLQARRKILLQKWIIKGHLELNPLSDLCIRLTLE